MDHEHTNNPQNV